MHKQFHSMLFGFYNSDLADQFDHITLSFNGINLSWYDFPDTTKPTSIEIIKHITHPSIYDK